MVNIVIAFGEPALPYLEEALQDNRSKVREEACVALGYIGGETAKTILQKNLEMESNERIITSLKGALQEIAIQENQRKDAKTR